MAEAKLDVKTPDGVSDSTIYTPDARGTWPGVVMLTDIFGVRDAFENMARRLAKEGYTVLLPNIYYRTSHMPVFKTMPSFADENGRGHLMKMKATLSPARMAIDGGAYVDALTAHAATHGHAKVGVVGYCMTGAMAMQTAAARPEVVAAAASFHGGHLCTDDAHSPHRLLPKIKARLYFGHAHDDASMPESAIDAFDNALAHWGGSFESEMYAGKHGWTVPGSAIYEPNEAERAWSELLTLFRETLQ